MCRPRVRACGFRQMSTGPGVPPRQWLRMTMAPWHEAQRFHCVQRFAGRHTRRSDGAIVRSTLLPLLPPLRTTPVNHIGMFHGPQTDRILCARGRVGQFYPGLGGAGHCPTRAEPPGAPAGGGTAPEPAAAQRPGRHPHRGRPVAAQAWPQHLAPGGARPPGGRARIARVLRVRLTRAFRAQLSDAALAISEGLSVAMQELLTTGLLDIALLYNSASGPGMETTALLEKDLFLVQRRSPGQPDAEDQAPLPLDELSRFPLVIPTRPNALRMLVESELAARGQRPQISLEIDGVAAILDLVADGAGCAVLPMNAVSTCGKPHAGHPRGKPRGVRRPPDRRRQPAPPAQQAVHGRQFAAPGHTHAAGHGATDTQHAANAVPVMDVEMGPCPSAHRCRPWNLPAPAYGAGAGALQISGGIDGVAAISRRSGSAHCLAIPAWAITSLQRRISAARCSPNCAGVLPWASRFSSSRRFFTSGRASAACTARDRRSSSAAGVPAGAARPFQELTLKCSSRPPLSRTVGTCGSCAARRAPSTARACRAPAPMCGIRAPRMSTSTCTWPPRTAAMSAGVPLKGTICASMPAVTLNSSAARCCVLPICGVPMSSCPGLARA